MMSYLLGEKQIDFVHKPWSKFCSQTVTLRIGNFLFTKYELTLQITRSGSTKKQKELVRFSNTEKQAVLFTKREVNCVRKLWTNFSL